MKTIINFFDKLEDVVRRKLSHVPIFYGLMAGIGVVVFWRGVWHSADTLMHYFQNTYGQHESINIGDLPWWDGPLSLVIGSALLLISGTFVSSFIGNEIIISGLRGEKKLAEKTRDELKTETGAIAEIKHEVKRISELLDELTEREKNSKS